MSVPVIRLVLDTFTAGMARLGTPASAAFVHKSVHTTASSKCPTKVFQPRSAAKLLDAKLVDPSSPDRAL
jgi:hypothetical protein